MGIQHHRSGAVRDRGAGELEGRQHGAFQMQMAVDEAGADNFAADVQAGPIVIAQADDKSIADGDIGLFQASLKDVRDLSPPEHQIRRRLAPGGQDSFLESF